jgi:phosphoribosylformylglycinamidine synthase
MISESQERMLCVVEPERVGDVLDVCARWQVNATAIGEVTASGRLRVFAGEELAGDLPVTALVDECPAYDLEPVEPATPLYPPPPRVLDEALGVADTLLALLASANLASRRWAFEQYDCLVGSRTARRPEQADAAVLLLPPPGVRPQTTSPTSNGVRPQTALDTSNGVRPHPANPLSDGVRAFAPATDDGPRPAIAVSIDGNGRRVAADPYRGAVEAVLECASNLACVGAEPLGLTNCLNFGNPEKPHIAWQLTRAVAGLGDACRALGVPVVGGNVSLYNEGGGGPIYPTPVVGMVGELPDARRAGRLGFAREGDAVAIVAAESWAPSDAASELAKLRGEPIAGPLPTADLGEQHALHAAVRQAVRSGALSSAHDVAEGGVAVAVAECCIAGGLGARVDLSDVTPFAEGPGAFVVSGSARSLAALGAAARIIGEVGGDALEIAGERPLPVDELTRVHADGLAALLV